MRTSIKLLVCLASSTLFVGTAACSDKTGTDDPDIPIASNDDKNRHLWGSIADESKGQLTNIDILEADYSKLLLSWRMLPKDDDATAFDLYRQDGKKWEKINSLPIYGSTNFEVPSAFVDFTKDNTYKLCFEGKEEALDTYTISAEQLKDKRPYISIYMQETASDARINDAPERRVQFTQPPGLLPRVGLDQMMIGHRQTVADLAKQVTKRIGAQDAFGTLPPILGVRSEWFASTGGPRDDASDDIASARKFKRPHVVVPPYI